MPPDTDARGGKKVVITCHYCGDVGHKVTFKHNLIAKHIVAIIYSYYKQFSNKYPLLELFRYFQVSTCPKMPSDLKEQHMANSPYWNNPGNSHKFS